MKIKVTSPSFSKNIELKNLLEKSFPNSILNIEGKVFTQEELIEYLQDADGAIVGLDSINEEVLSKLPNLKVVSKYGVGLDNIDSVACEKYGVSVGWTGGVNKTSVAEMSLAFMISMIRELYLRSNQLKNGNWNKLGGYNLSGKTIGIIGVGYVGKELIRLLKPFNCKILVNDILDQKQFYKENNLIEVSKEELFRLSDIVTLHVPLTEKTKYLISEKTLNMMKKTAYLINTSRGSIVNQNDLKKALKNNIIAGASLDVYEEEPPKDKSFLNLENLICTPHIGGSSYESILNMGKSAIENLELIYKKESL